MSNQLATQEAIGGLVLAGDLSKMTDPQKVQYYMAYCERLGLNPLSQPFKILKLQGKEIMYATKDCSDQLRKRDGISIPTLSSELIGDIYQVTATAKNKDGKTDSDIGAVSIAALRGEALANAYMKATTKAKRRVTLSICGLGIPDESEIETIDANATVMDFPKEPAKQPLTEKAFTTAAERIAKGDKELIGKLRATFLLTEEQRATLLHFEDSNVVTA
jgi:hypothetical protein